MDDPGHERSGPRQEAAPTSSTEVTVTPPADIAAWQRSVPPGRGTERGPRDAPGRAATIWAQMPFVAHSTREQRKVWFETIRAERARAQQRRERVLAHPDLAARLARALDLRVPQNWNGYVPPAMNAPLENGVQTINDSPIRREVIEILKAVAAREAQTDVSERRAG